MSRQPYVDRTQDPLIERLARAATAEGWEVAREVMGPSWRADLLCYRDGARIVLEAEAGTSCTSLPIRHYRRLHAGAWTFWFFRRPRRRNDYGFPVYSAEEIEERVAEFLGPPVPRLLMSADPIARTDTRQSVYDVWQCPVCGVVRTVAGDCWWCRHTGRPFYTLWSAERVQKAIDDAREDRVVATAAPTREPYVSQLHWREQHRLVRCLSAYSPRLIGPTCVPVSEQRPIALTEQHVRWASQSRRWELEAAAKKRTERAYWNWFSQQERPCF